MLDRGCWISWSCELDPVHLRLLDRLLPPGNATVPTLCKSNFTQVFRSNKGCIIMLSVSETLTFFRHQPSGQCGQSAILYSSSLLPQFMHSWTRSQTLPALTFGHPVTM